MSARVETWLPEPASRELAAGLAYLEADSDEGRAYLADADFAGRYARASRGRMLDAAAALIEETLGIARDPPSFVACDHNHVRLELHGGRPLWVHRKGAMRVGPEERGVVPGSMGSPSFHVEGRGHDAALWSSAHGAGRALRRGEARRRVSTKDLEREVSGVWFDHRLADRLREEAPSAYKDIGAVMRAQRALVKIIRRVEPVLSYKAA